MAQSLSKELTSWRFVLCVVIWYNVLYQINRVSKLLQSPKMSIDVLKRETDNVKTFSPRVQRWWFFHQLKQMQKKIAVKDADRHDLSCCTTMKTTRNVSL